RARPAPALHPTPPPPARRATKATLPPASIVAQHLQRLLDDGHRPLPRLRLVDGREQEKPGGQLGVLEEKTEDMPPGGQIDAARRRRDAIDEECRLRRTVQPDGHRYGGERVAPAQHDAPAARPRLTGAVFLQDQSPRLFAEALDRIELLFIRHGLALSKFLVDPQN